MKDILGTTPTDTFKNSQIDYFNTHQPHLDPRLSTYTKRLADALVEALALKSSDAILEIGCGSGRFTLPLTKHNLSITALDYAPALTQQLEDLHLRAVSVITGDIDDLPTLTHEKFDHVIGFFILHHLADVEKSITHLKSALKLHATIGFIEPNPLNPLYYIQPFVSKNMSWGEEKGFRDMTHKKLTKALGSAGFKDIKITKFGLFPPFVVNTSVGLKSEEFLEKLPFIKKVCAFQLITATIK